MYTPTELAWCTPLLSKAGGWSLVPTLRVGMPSGRSASRVSHARRGASPRHSHAERGNEGKRHTPLRLINTEAEILRYFPSPPAPLPEGEGRKKIRENFCFST